jgi:ABC-type Zn2+ transport system substrate-binding protein/surface adhesin
MTFLGPRNIQDAPRMTSIRVASNRYLDAMAKAAEDDHAQENTTDGGAHTHMHTHTHAHTHIHMYTRTGVNLYGDDMLYDEEDRYCCHTVVTLLHCGLR